ncbi:putative 2-haloalkanoic acid dehalogenase [Seiridium cupressi]
MASSGNKHIVFDVVGTCISYEAFYEALEARIGERLRKQNIGARIFGYAWMEAGEKEYTYLSQSGKYVVYSDVFRSIFYRTLWQAGVKEPRKLCTDEDREFLLASYRTLKPRPGLAQCFSKLREAGFKVWALTSGDVERVSGYLASGGIDFPSENFVSCDSIGVGKPAPACYQHLLDKFPAGDRDAWFAAAHMWDAAAARRTGFKAAWVSVWEQEQCSDIFGEMDVVADDLLALADGIIASSKE